MIIPNMKAGTYWDLIGSVYKILPVFYPYRKWIWLKEAFPRNNKRPDYSIGRFYLEFSTLAQVFAELSSDRRMPQPAERLRFDLPYTLPGHAHLPSYFLKCVGLTIK